MGILLAISGVAVIAVATAFPSHPAQPPFAATGSVARPHLAPPVSMTSRSVEQVLPRSRPVALDIPSIGVHSSLLSLGLNADGTIEVPSGTSYDEAGWYRFSPTPGSLGPAVILGHVSSGARGPSVFFELGLLRPGDRVRVTRRDRSIAVFESRGFAGTRKIGSPPSSSTATRPTRRSG